MCTVPKALNQRIPKESPKLVILLLLYLEQIYYDNYSSFQFTYQRQWKIVCSK